MPVACDGYVPPDEPALEFANYSDLGMNFGLLLCMMGAAFLVDVREGHGERVLGEFLFFTVILVFVIALGVLGHAGYRRLQPGDGFGVFLERVAPLWSAFS